MDDIDFLKKISIDILRNRAMIYELICMLKDSGTITEGQARYIYEQGQRDSWADSDEEKEVF